MVTDGVRIESLAAARAHLASPDGPRSVLVVPVAETVPAWLADLVREAGAGHADVVVEAVAPGGLTADQRAGWEIGVALAALQAGVGEVRGIPARRLARVRTVVDALAAPTRSEVGERRP